jgi:hypothetical protein
MASDAIEPQVAAGSSSRDLAGLRSQLLVLRGEPFRFTRNSYGDELTLHFGDVRPAWSPKLRKKPYGTHSLGLLGSSWLLEALSQSSVIASEGTFSFGTLLSKEELEARTFVEPESRLMESIPSW